jgi:hypothetical protein
MRSELTNDQILETLYAAPTKAAAARALGVSRTTLYEWLSDPAIGEAYQAWKEEAMRDASDSLHSRAAGAVGVLDEIAHNAAVTPAVRVQAAAHLLNYHYRSRESEELEQRLAEIEQAIS